jgi:hypothetical protein
LFVVGATSFEGAAFRLDGAPGASVMEVNVSELQLGLGLGGAVGVSAFFAFNVVGPLWSINNSTSGISFAFNVAVPGEKLGVGSHVANVLQNLDTIGKDTLKTLDAVSVQDLSDLAQIVYAGWQSGSSQASGQPSFIVIDIPGAGWGAQVMVGGSNGQFSTLG